MRYPVVALVAAVLGTPALAQPGRIIAIGDEWLLSDQAFTQQPAQSQQLAANIASYFSGPTGNFLVLSNSPAVNFPGQRGGMGDSLAFSMISGGHSWIVNPEEFTISLAALQSYDAVFFSGTVGSGAANAAILAQYVQGGGNVLVMAGTGDHGGGSSGEAAAWNPFLNQFGLGFGDSWFGLRSGPDLISVPTVPTGHALGSSLTTVLWDNGQTAMDLDPNDPLNAVAVLGDFTGLSPLPAGDPSRTSIIATYNVPVPTPGGAGGACVLLALTARHLSRRRR